MGDMRKSQIENMIGNCGQCIHKDLPKSPVDSGDTICYSCIYNAVMVKTNSFILADKRSA